jgi:hypothetical protein
MTVGWLVDAVCNFDAPPQRGSKEYGRQSLSRQGAFSGALAGRARERPGDIGASTGASNEGDAGPGLKDNNRLLSYPRGANCAEEPASEADRDRPVDHEKRGFGPWWPPCTFNRAESHGLSELTGLAAADLIDNALYPVCRRKDRTDLAAVVEEAKDRHVARILGEECFVAWRQFAAHRWNGHPEGAHELELLGRQFNGRPNERTSSIPTQTPEEGGAKSSNSVFGLPAANAGAQR